MLRLPHTYRISEGVKKKLRRNRNHNSCEKSATGMENTGIRRIPAGIGNLDDSNGASGRWIKSSEGVVGVRRGGCFVSVSGRCVVVHGGGGGKGGVEEVMEWELCCFGGNERSSDENFGSPV